MPAGIGYGKRARGRGRGIAGIRRLPGGNLSVRSPFGVNAGSEGAQISGRPGLKPQATASRTTGRGRGKGGVGAQAMPGPGGRQLQSRVQSGAISGDQARKTLMQRQTLQKAFGKDWRTKVFGDAGYAKRTRSALAKDPANPTLAALNKKLMERRQQMLTAARKRNQAE